MFIYLQGFKYHSHLSFPEKLSNKLKITFIYPSKFSIVFFIPNSSLTLLQLL